MFLHFLFTTCLIRKLEEKPLNYYYDLIQKTVVLIDAEIMYRMSPKDTFTVIPKDHMVNLNLKINKSSNKGYEAFRENKGSFVSQYVRYVPETKLFFTAIETDYYQFEFSIENVDDDYEYFLKTNIYEGRQGDPSIMSQTDNQIRELRKNIEDAMEYIGQISNVQKLDGFRDEEYYSLIKSIRNIVLVIIGLKIVVFVCMFNWFNKQLRHFYVSKKIVRN